MTNNALPPELEFADDGDGDDARRDRRQGRIRMTAWIAIIAMVVAGGGATVLTLLFG